jgi:signal transduction histidine kinase
MRRRPFTVRMRRILAMRIDRQRALPLAATLAVIAGAADALSTAEACFTLVFLVPIMIAVWFHGRRAGIAVLALCSILSIGVDATVGPHHADFILVALNSLGEVGLYVVFAVLTDVLRRKLSTEAELRMEALTQLRHADRLTTVGRLAAGIAHELGTPLNVVGGKASLISSGRTTGDSAKTSARVIEQQAERMTAIVRQLLDFARRGGTGRRPTNLHALAEETAELLRPMAKTIGATITCEGKGAEASVSRGEMQQVISNLVTNAIHAARKGGAIRIATDVGEHEAVIRVQDNGYGIEPHILPRIFDPFFTTKDVGQGTGLGLSVVHGIVSDHGGTISVDSEVGRGTTFTLRLPT